MRCSCWTSPASACTTATSAGLIGVLHRLRDAGNTLLIVEHDPAVIRAADHVIDLGPGPGRQGGRIQFAGPVAGLQRFRHP